MLTRVIISGLSLSDCSPMYGVDKHEMILWTVGTMNEIEIFLMEIWLSFDLLGESTNQWSEKKKLNKNWGSLFPKYNENIIVVRTL